MSVTVGSTPSTKVLSFWEGDIPFVTPSDITELTEPVLTATARTITDEGLANSNSHLVPKGSVLVATRATIGPAAIAGTDLATNQGVTALIPRPGVESDWLYYWVCANRHEFVNRGTGNTFPEVARSKSRQIPLSLPEIDVQRRVGDLARSLDRTYVALRDEERSLTDARHLIASSVWQADAPLARLADLGHTSTGKTPSTKEARYWTPSDIPFFTPGDFNGCLELDTASRFLSTAGSAVARQLPTNTVGQVCIGATLGKAAVFTISGTTNQQINCLSGLGKSDAVFLAALLSCPAGEKNARRRASQTTLPILKKSSWEAWKIPWPDGAERKKLGALFMSFDNAAKAISESIRDLTLLRDAVLTALYHGSHAIPHTYDRLLAKASR